MGQQIYFYLPRMNTAERWLSLHHPALERATPIYRRICPLSRACLAPVFVYADSALDKPGTAGFALAVSSM
jgi:hypothetical protein